MSTVLRPELAKSNLYFLPKHRFYELKHFCLQYPLWKKLLRSMDGYKSKYDFEKFPGLGFWKSSVETTVDIRENLKSKVEMIEKSAKLADLDLSMWLLKGVTEGLSYTALACTYDMPCSKDMYYDRFRKFFWILSKERN